VVKPLPEHWLFRDLKPEKFEVEFEEFTPKDEQVELLKKVQYYKDVIIKGIEFIARIKMNYPSSDPEFSFWLVPFYYKIKIIFCPGPRYAIRIYRGFNGSPIGFVRIKGVATESKEEYHKGEKEFKQALGLK